MVWSSNAAIAAALAAEIPEVTILHNDEVVAASDVIFLCLLARMAEDVLPSLPFHAGHTILSAKVDMRLAR